MDNYQDRCYAITVADMACIGICYKPCLPGCSGGQGELKKAIVNTPPRRLHKKDVLCLCITILEMLMHL